MRRWKQTALIFTAICICAGTVGCGEKKSELEQLEEFAEAVFTDEVKSKAESTATTMPEPEEIDAFADLQVTFTGTYPQSSVQYSGGRSHYVDYTLSKENGVKNGDVVTVTAKVKLQYEDDYVLSETSKDYTAEGLASYVMTLSELPEETMEKMKAQAVDVIKAYAADRWVDEASLETSDYLGCYFLSPKDNFNGSYTNQFYLVYEVKANFENCYYKPDDNRELCDGWQSYFTYVKYTDVILLPDGTTSVDLSSNHLCPNEFESDWSTFSSSLYFKGYNDLDSMFNDCVTSQIDNFSYENTVAQQ